MESGSGLTICMFSNLYPPVYSGSATQCAQLARELVKRGCRVIVITALIDAKSQDYEMMDGVHVYRLPAIRLPKMQVSLNFPWLNATFTPANVRRIEKIFCQHQPDVVHLHNHMFDLAFSAVLAVRRYQIPLVITIHTVIKHPRSIFNWLLYPADRWFLKHLVIRKADVLICPDSTIVGYVSDAFAHTNTVLVPYGISQPGIPTFEEMEKLRQKHELGNSPVILSLGHLHEIRNRKELIEMMPELLKYYPDLKLLIVGDIGTRSAEILASRLGIQDALRFSGAVPHSEVPAYLGIAMLEAHWFRVNNPQNKTLGIAALEAMAAGKVVVGTADESVYGEGVLRNGENVILIDLDNLPNLKKQMLALLGDEPRRITIGQHASRTISEHFSWDSVCSETIRVYHATIEKAISPAFKK